MTPTAPASTTPTPTNDPIRDVIRSAYAEIAKSGEWLGREGQTTLQAATESSQPATQSSCCSPSGSGGGCCGPSTLTPAAVAAAIGYSESDLKTVPEGSNMGLSCGNPMAIANLKPGNVVVDLGSGGGFDCFVAGPRVGASGRAIGVDMTAAMLSKARENLTAYRAASGLDNVEFRLGEIENLPVADGVADVVISNCVINLSPEKPRVYREIMRILKPGGKMAVSDLVLLRPLPKVTKADFEALIGCIAGASLVSELKADLLAAGFIDVVLTPKPGYVDAMVSSEDPLYRRMLSTLPAGTTVADFVTSLDIVAVKPAKPQRCCG